VLVIAQLPRISKLKRAKHLLKCRPVKLERSSYDVLILPHGGRQLESESWHRCIALARNVAPMRSSGATAAGRFIRLAWVFDGSKKQVWPD